MLPQITLIYTENKKCGNLRNLREKSSLTTLQKNASTDYTDLHRKKAGEN
jgi:hypothetical protein